jgi:hypothetical protein
MNRKGRNDHSGDSKEPDHELKWKFSRGLDSEEPKIKKYFPHLQVPG